MLIFFLADNGAMGRTGNETVQRLSGSERMVFRTHGERHLVASTNIAQVSKSNGSANVSEALHSRHSTFKV